MKLIRKWIDTKYNVENYIYENPDGLKVLHTLNKQSLDTYISVVVKAGTYFEKQLNVPNGTAHFLEHMLCNPNSFFKSENEIDRFEFGSKEKASIYFNPGTSFRYIMLCGTTHKTREEDLMKRVYSTIDYPLDMFTKQIPKEKKIILAELQGDKKPEQDAELQFLKFTLSDKVYTNDFSILGETEENIKKISVEDLVKYYTNTFTIPNCMVSIQSPNEISKEIVKYIDLISSRLKSNDKDSVKILPEVIVNSKIIGYFHNKQKNGIKTRLFTFQSNKWRKSLDYEYLVLRSLTISLIHFVLFKQLREKYGYIYGSNVYSNSMWEVDIEGLEITTDFSNLKNAIEKLFEIIQKGLTNFLKTKHGNSWLQNEISGFIFPHTQEYNESYAETKAMSHLSGYEFADFDKASEVAKEVTVEKLSKFVDETIGKSTFGVWIDSSEDLEKVKREIKKVNALKGYI